MHHPGSATLHVSLDRCQSSRSTSSRPHRSDGFASFLARGGSRGRRAFPRLRLAGPASTRKAVGGDSSIPLGSGVRPAARDVGRAAWRRISDRTPRAHLVRRRDSRREHRERLVLAHLRGLRSRSSQDRRAARRRAEAVVRMSGHGWMVSVYGTTWHRAVSGGGAPVAACGERIFGPVHRRLAEPVDDPRDRCCACREGL